MNHFEYKGYIGSIEVSLPDNCLHGKILFITDLINYEATSVENLKKEFENAVDDYLDTCKELRIEPKSGFKGSFHVTVGQELHEKADIKAARIEKSLNNYLKDMICKDTESQA